jgi:hypothetical protein
MLLNRERATEILARARLDALDGGPLDLELAAGMVLSVDCPLLDVGVGGSAHLEDMMLITVDGSRPLHTVDEPLILV